MQIDGRLALSFVFDALTSVAIRICYFPFDSRAASVDSLE